jgi:mono/diheme cytochrome c family protein
MRAPLVLLCFAAIGCNTQFAFYAPTPKGQVARGRAIFVTRGLGAVPYACVDCHTDEPDDPARPSLTPAHSLYDAAARKAWYGGRFKTRAVQGAQECLEKRMGGRRLEGDDQEALQAFLASISPSRRVEPLPDAGLAPAPSTEIAGEELAEARAFLGAEVDVDDGIARGLVLYRRACAGCHDPARSLAPDLITKRFSTDSILAASRGGKGAMPAFGKDRISDEDLADIARFLDFAARP